jgi:hypothetical protein
MANLFVRLADGRGFPLGHQEDIPGWTLSHLPMQLSKLSLSRNCGEN